MRLYILVSLAVMAFPANAGGVTCENSLVTATTDNPQLAADTCEAVKRAEALFAQCNVPQIPVPLSIRVVPELEPGCVAMYHCGDGLIEILAPSAMLERRGSDGAFGFLSADAFFDSVVVHELAHAAYDGTPCPVESCRATNEYLAYAMQITSLGLDQQFVFSKNSGIDRRVLDDEINVMLLALAPDLFAQRVWAHLSQRDDPCGFVEQIIKGSVYFDRIMP